MTVNTEKFSLDMQGDCEIKNITSLRSLGKAIEYEARRQVELIESGQNVEQQTRHWDEAEGRTHK